MTLAFLCVIRPLESAGALRPCRPPMIGPAASGSEGGWVMTHGLAALASRGIKRSPTIVTEALRFGGDPSKV